MSFMDQYPNTKGSYIVMDDTYSVRQIKAYDSTIASAHRSVKHWLNAQSLGYSQVQKINQKHFANDWAQVLFQVLDCLKQGKRSKVLAIKSFFRETQKSMKIKTKKQRL